MRRIVFLLSALSLLGAGSFFAQQKDAKPACSLPVFASDRSAWRRPGALFVASVGGCVRLFLILSTEVEDTMAHAQRFLALVNDAKKRIKETNVADVKRRMDAGEKFILVDVREESEWAGGHLPGAIHLGKGIIERDVEQRVPDTGAKLICYCGGGFRSALVADSLQKMGYTNVESMDGGWKGWLAVGYPTKGES